MNSDIERSPEKIEQQIKSDWNYLMWSVKAKPRAHRVGEG